MTSLAPFGKSQWIWPGLAGTLLNSYSDYRRDFRLGSVPRRAPFFITADQNYTLYLNGKYVGRGPARGFQSHWPYDEYDLGPLLRRGGNWLAVRVYNSGASSGQYIHQSVAGLICAGKFGGADLATDGTWQMRLTPGNRDDTAHLSWLLSFQEHSDARAGGQEWITSPSAPKGWTHDVWARPRAAGSMPWHSFEPRGIPNLGSEVLRYRQVIGAASGASAAGWSDWRNVAVGMRGELTGAAWSSAEAGGPASLQIPATGTGRWRTILLDMGKPVIGTLMVDASGGRGLETLDFCFMEHLEDDGSPSIPDGRVGCGSAMGCRLRLKKGRTRHEFFPLIGHRYLAAMVRESSGPITLRLSLRFSVYPMDIRGRFESDHPTLEGIYRICVNTQRICALDAYVDTPWREQAQWWGDARVQAQNTFHLCGDARLVARGIRQIGQQEVPNGLTYGHAPTNRHNCILPDFSLIWLITLWDYHWQTGDLALFVEQWPRARRVLDYFQTEGRDPATGLLCHDPRYWLFLDWTEIHRDPVPTVLNLWYVITLQKLRELAAAAGMRKEARELGALLAAQLRLVERHLWDDKVGLYHDGLDAGGRPVASHSVHSQTLAMHAGLHPEARWKMLDHSLLPYARDDKIEGLAQPSSYWVTYVYEALAAVGHRSVVINHILRHFAKMIPGGGTWENFDVMITDTIASRTHAWTAHPIYHFTRIVGGVTQTAAAWKRVRFSPEFSVAGVTRARIAVPSPQGLIEASWERAGSGFDVRLSLPSGVTADVDLPGISRRPVTGSHTWRLR